MNTSNHMRGINNEQRVLRAIGLVGWLSTTQIAKWVWGLENAHSARVSAEKVLKRLIERGYVLRRESSLRMCVFVLTKLGANYANDGLALQLFRHGYDLSQLDTARQRPAVEYLIQQHHLGRIVMGIAGLRRALQIGMFEEKGLKGADGIILDNADANFRPILVIRNAHIELIKKAKRIKKVTGTIHLIGTANLVHLFHEEMRK
jgi:hypothetical protein